MTQIKQINQSGTSDAMNLNCIYRHVVAQHACNPNVAGPSWQGVPAIACRRSGCSVLDISYLTIYYSNDSTAPGGGMWRLSSWPVHRLHPAKAEREPIGGAVLWALSTCAGSSQKHPLWRHTRNTCRLIRDSVRRMKASQALSGMLDPDRSSQCSESLRRASCRHREGRHRAASVSVD